MLLYIVLIRQFPNISEDFVKIKKKYLVKYRKGKKSYFSVLVVIQFCLYSTSNQEEGKSLKKNLKSACRFVWSIFANSLLIQYITEDLWGFLNIEEENRNGDRFKACLKQLLITRFGRCQIDMKMT